MILSVLIVITVIITSFIGFNNAQDRTRQLIENNNNNIIKNDNKTTIENFDSIGKNLDIAKKRSKQLLSLIRNRLLFIITIIIMPFLLVLIILYFNQYN